MTDDIVIESTEPAEATFTDDAGIRQLVGFFGLPGRKTFGAFHLPSSAASAGLLICPALHSDFERTYRRDVLLSRALCARGYAVHRFHYRGIGNSDGRASDVTYESMREDATDAAERLRYIAGVRSVAFMGTRWGALVAAGVAADEKGAPLALLDPTVRPARYFREAGRARAVRDAKVGQTPIPWQELVGELDSSGTIDVLGYSIDKELYDSAIGLTLPDLLGDSPRPVLLMHLGGERSFDTAYASMIEEWREKGFDVEARALAKEEGWWFVGDAWEAIESRASTQGVLEATTEWMSRWRPANDRPTT